jgi:hypothetical protein
MYFFVIEIETIVYYISIFISPPFYRLLSIIHDPIIPLYLYLYKTEKTSHFHPYSSTSIWYSYLVIYMFVSIFVLEWNWMWEGHYLIFLQSISTLVRHVSWKWLIVCPSQFMDICHPSHQLTHVECAWGSTFTFIVQLLGFPWSIRPIILNPRCDIWRIAFGYEFPKISYQSKYLNWHSPYGVKVFKLASSLWCIYRFWCDYNLCNTLDWMLGGHVTSDVAPELYTFLSQCFN